jgi:hypothetical protein
LTEAAEYADFSSIEAADNAEYADLSSIEAADNAESTRTSHLLRPRTTRRVPGPLIC